MVREGEGSCWLRGEDEVLRGDGRSKRAGVGLAEPPADPPEADWCPPESDTTQVRPAVRLLADKLPAAHEG